MFAFLVLRKTRGNKTHFWFRWLAVDEYLKRNWKQVQILYVIKLKITIDMKILAAVFIDSAGDVSIQNARNRPTTRMMACITPR